MTNRVAVDSASATSSSKWEESLVHFNAPVDAVVGRKVHSTKTLVLFSCQDRKTHFHVLMCLNSYFVEPTNSFL